MTRRLLLMLAACALVTLPVRSQAPIRYRFSFPEPQHRWMQVEATFDELDPRPLELRMSRSSPGRYALHDFAKNVYEVRVLDRNGRELKTDRSDESGWTVTGHGGAATVTYRVYGDRLDGTYLAIDETHAHINMPAVVMWARGLDDRAVTVTFERPANTSWDVATQLHEGSRALEFTAPNLQYLMDSPAEFGSIVWRRFALESHAFRFAAHHTGTDRELDAFVTDVERIAREEAAIFGEFPAYEPGHYTFLADYLPVGQDDGMEHRNSAVLTSDATIVSRRVELLEGVAHELFHSWNVERIRPRSLEPFDLERVNVSSDLWLAEGFTQYYGSLVLGRAGLADHARTANTFGDIVDGISVSGARSFRSAEEMSQMAPFVDGGRPMDRTNWSRTVLSYYSYGAAIALALDLSLRDRSDGRVSLDDFMRAMWRNFGRPGGSREGFVNRPYTGADAEDTLAEVSEDRAFARDFFARFIRGRETADYPRLLGKAGLVVRKTAAGRAWLGDLSFVPGSRRIAELVAPKWPVYDAGLEQDDLLEQLDGQRIQSDVDVARIVGRHKPGDRIPLTYQSRSGRSKTAVVTLAEDPHVEVVTIESAGGRLTSAQRDFRAGWLGTKG